MLQLIKFTSILIVWSLVILYLNKKETFQSISDETTTTGTTGDNGETTGATGYNGTGVEEATITFEPWGKTKTGCINRCILFNMTNKIQDDSSSHNYDIIKSQCTKKCEDCSTETCEWTSSITKFNNIKSVNNFYIQLIPGNNNVIIKWTYYNNNDLEKIKNPIFNYEESFYLIQKNTNIPIQFTFKEKDKEKIEDYDKYESNEYEIYRPLENHDNPLIKNDWYIKNKTNEISKKICNNETHPLNSKWENTDFFDKFKKIDDIKYDIELTNFIIQLVDAKNPDNGIQVYKYKDDSEKNGKLLNPEKNLNKIYKKEIKNLKTNTDYKLSIYPLFNKIDKTNNNTEIITGKDDKINDTSENILFSTKDFIVINK